uniref:DUF3891 family protein n=1 Tax=Microcoleus sp. LEGE 07076 TaxID=915322 RepID=UPI0030DB8AAF
MGSNVDFYAQELLSERRKAGRVEGTRRFCGRTTRQPKKWREELHISQKESAAAYAFFQWCDRLSLILCSRDFPAGERALEISVRPDGKRYDIVQNSNQFVTVTPWRFEEDKFTVKVEASHLDQVKFETNEKSKEALGKAPREMLEWTWVKS